MCAEELFLSLWYTPFAHIKQIRRPKKGVYALNPKDIQKISVTNNSSVNTIGKSIDGSYIN